MALAITFPVAQNIADSIEEPRKISLIIVVRNEARRYYTSALRSYLSSLGIVPDKRKSKDNSIDDYLNQLEAKVKRLSKRNGRLVVALKRAYAKKEHRRIVELLSLIFSFLSEPDEAESWESREAPLDRWLI